MPIPPRTASSGGGRTATGSAGPQSTRADRCRGRLAGHQPGDVPDRRRLGGRGVGRRRTLYAKAGNAGKVREFARRIEDSFDRPAALVDAAAKRAKSAGIDVALIVARSIGDPITRPPRCCPSRPRPDRRSVVDSSPRRSGRGDRCDACLRSRRLILQPPAGVVRVRGREPLRSPVRSGVRSWGAAPITAVSSASINAW